MELHQSKGWYERMLQNDNDGDCEAGGPLPRPIPSEGRDLRLKTAAMYILADWMYITPDEVLAILTGYVPDLELTEVSENIKRRGRHDLRIEVNRILYHN